MQKLYTKTKTQLALGSLDDEKNAINLSFSNNLRKNKTCPLSLSLSSDAQLYMVANFKCLLEVQSMFAKAFNNDDKMLEYYRNVASEQLFKYVNEGSEFMMSV